MVCLEQASDKSCMGSAARTLASGPCGKREDLCAVHAYACGNYLHMQSARNEVDLRPYGIACGIAEQPRVKHSLGIGVLRP